jgi:hypothetical protein
VERHVTVKIQKKPRFNDEALILERSDWNMLLEIWAFWVYADFSAVLIFPLKPDITINLREERVIAAKPDVIAWVQVRSTLPNEDISGCDAVPRKSLDAKPFTAAISPITCTSAAFFMRHLLLPPRVYVLVGFQ